MTEIEQVIYDSIGCPCKVGDQHCSACEREATDLAARLGFTPRTLFDAWGQEVEAYVREAA